MSARAGSLQRRRGARPSKREPRPRARLTPRAALLGAVVLLLAVSLIVPTRQYLAQRSEMADLERRIELLAGERDRLRQRVEDLRDPAELERIARECLGMVKPGETAFAPIPKSGKLPRPDC